MQWNYAFPFEAEQQDALLYYTKVPGATASVVTAIKNTYNGAMDGSDNFGAINGGADPYRAYMKDYVWGSNGTKSHQGNMYQNILVYALDPAKNTAAEQAAARYIHYIHGTNPLGMVYLSNMKDHGAENSANEFYHAWFENGNALWDRAGESTYGPAPGFLTGGPNPSYDWDGCCPSNCGSAETTPSARRGDQPAEGAAGAEVVQGLQHELAAELVVRHRELERLPGGVHPAAVEIREVKSPHSPLTSRAARATTIALHAIRHRIPLVPNQAAAPSSQPHRPGREDLSRRARRPAQKAPGRQGHGGMTWPRGRGACSSRWIRARITTRVSPRPWAGRGRTPRGPDGSGRRAAM